MVNPNAKGAAYERGVCQRLSLWVSDMEREDVFWRSAMSGGRAKLKSRKARGKAFSAQSGDISAIHPLGNLLLDYFVIECKFYQNLQLRQVVYGREGKLDQIWEEPSQEARRTGREPLTIARQNRQQDIVLTTAKGIEWLSCGSDEALPVLATFPPRGIHVMMFADMLMLDFNRIREVYDE